MLGAILYGGGPHQPNFDALASILGFESTRNVDDGLTGVRRRIVVVFNASISPTKE
jgi:hypothetical protein